MTSRPLSRPFRDLPVLVVLVGLALVGGCGGDAPPAPDGPRGLVILPPDPATLVPLPEDVRPRNNFHYFGAVPDGESVEHTFHLRNVESVPIAITRVSPGCGCVVPRISYTRADGEVVRALSNRSGEEKLLEIPPGEEADLVVRVDTARIAGKNAHKVITTTVTTDCEQSRFLTFEVSVLPSAPFQLNPRALEFGRIPMSAGGEESLDIVPVGDSGTRIAGLGAVPEGMEVDLEPGSLLGREMWVLKARWMPPLAPGPHEGTVVLDTATPEGVAGRPLEVTARCTAVTDVQADSRLVLVLRGVPTDPGVAETEVYSLLSGHRLRIVAAEVEEKHREDLLLEFEPREPDGEGRSERWTLRLRPRHPLPEGVLAGEATVTLDDPQTPRIRVSYAVHVDP